MANKAQFAELLVTYYGRCGWKQSELAKRMGVHRNTIASWESGAIPSRGIVLRLADELLLSQEERKGLLVAAGMSIEHWPAAYWDVPYPRNPYFIGRQTVLHTLRQTLVPGARTTALTQSLSGLGGIGKTQVAVEYAHQYGKYYEAVLWIPADSLAVATAVYLRLATEVLGLPEQQEADQQLAAVKGWLQKHAGWLLIFDNVEDPHAILSTFVPSKHQGSVLITTRRRELGTLAHSEILPLFSEEDAILFLLRRSKRIARQAPVTKATESDIVLARELCQLLDRLPLALDQAGAYIAENRKSLKQYIDLYHQRRQDLLDRRQAKDLSNITDHPDSVFMTFWLSWETIQEQNALAGKALQFCAFLAPDQIPVSLVVAGITASEQPSDTLATDEALGLIYRYSLVEWAEQILSLHRLVQEVIQEVLAEEERQQWMEQTVHLVNAIFPSGEYGTWAECEFLLPHALMCAKKWIPVLKHKKLEGAQLLHAAAYYLNNRAQYKEAEPLYQHALAITQEQLGTDHPATATSFNNLALFYHEQSRYAEAEPLYERALMIIQEQLGLDHLDTAASLNNLAGLYRAQGRYTEAELLYQRALMIIQEQLGANHLQTATSFNNLAGLYRAQSRYTEAKPLYEHALKITQEQLGANHPQTATSFSNLAGLYRAQGRYAEAESLFQRALHIREEQLGADHPQTATSLSNLATLYYEQRRYAEAEPLYEHALMIIQEQLGADHLKATASFNNLAALYRAQGRYAEAESLFQRALTITEKQLGANHPDTATSLNNLAALYYEQKRYAEAERFFQRALMITEKQLGANHLDTAIGLNNLATLYYEQRRYAEAEPLLQRATTIALASLGREHPQTQQMQKDYFTLLSHLYTNGDLEALLQLLVQKEQGENRESEETQE
ncbi:tetratricopeptide repeat protein [Ktedonobacter sp. SOSP1-52]|uniref:FxSxx-COOH system tetratricopeptide repeat protein n=1 Tax=Ktedonobacter sp. SOSP1-52 TaxID=2778366 RepID=UPI001915FC4B|nr:FxSxx-COOH system tetratricopeptide repeat protein [Ktedonobacter sp. SOSP1-52]GHO65594.1 tetratricopeptide repeat protein [Ktedonobacter sp. SOSP1-52]